MEQKNQSKNEGSINLPNTDISLLYTEWWKRYTWEEQLLNSFYEINSREYSMYPGHERWPGPPMDCSATTSRVLGYPRWSTHPGAENYVGNFLGNPVNHNPNILQLVVWQGRHMGFTRDYRLWDWYPAYVDPYDRVFGRDLIAVNNGIGISPIFFNIGPRY